MFIKKNNILNMTSDILVGTSANAYLRSGEQFTIITLRNILNNCSKMALPTPNNKGKFGMIVPYISGIMCDESTSDGVIFIDIDKCSEYSDKIMSSFDSIIREVPNVIAINKSHNGNLHIFAYDEDVRNDASIYQERAMMHLALTAKAILHSTGVDLREIQGALDFHNTNISQRFFLNRSDYHYNDNYIHYAVTNDTKEELFDEYKVLFNRNHHPTTNNRKNNINIDVHKETKQIERYECVDKPETLIIDRDKFPSKKFYKYKDKYQIADTLSSAGYSESEIYRFMLDICYNMNNKPDFEKNIRSIVTTSIRKPCVYKSALKELEAWGIKLKFKTKNFKEFIETESDFICDYLPIYDYEFDLGEMYMSDYVGFNEKEINLNNIPHNTKFIYINADCGAGKTEFIKNFARTHVCDIVLPMNSVMAGKFCDDSLEKITKAQQYNLHVSQVMILDTFSELGECKDTIFIDESHLLISQSEYRDILYNVVDRINSDERIKRVILLTGTPIGEHLLFDNSYNIRLYKKQNNKKIVNVYLTDNCYDTAKYILTEAIDNGIVPFVPTNRNVKNTAEYFESLGIKYDIYDKSRRTSEFSNNINNHNKVGDVNAFISTTYLNVGNEIKEDKNIQTFIINCINEEFTGQDIHQYANRMRNSDITINIVVKDGFGIYESAPKSEAFFLDDNLAQMEISQQGILGYYMRGYFKWIDEQEIKINLKSYKERCEETLKYMRNFKVVIDILRSYGYEINVIEFQPKSKLKINNNNNNADRVSVLDFIYDYGACQFVRDYEKCFDRQNVFYGDNYFDKDNSALYIKDVNYTNKIYSIIKGVEEILRFGKLHHKELNEEDIIEQFMTFDEKDIVNHNECNDDIVMQILKKLHKNDGTICVSKGYRLIAVTKGLFNNDALLHDILYLKRQGLLCKDKFKQTLKTYVTDRYNGKEQREIDFRMKIFDKIFKGVAEFDDLLLDIGDAIDIVDVINDVIDYITYDGRSKNVIMERNGELTEWRSMTEFCKINDFNYNNAVSGFSRRGCYKGWKIMT